MYHWPKIENTYRSKYLDSIRARHGDLVDDAVFVVTEKIHGSNFQWFFQPYQTPVAASRNQVIDRGAFHGVKIGDLCKEHTETLDHVQGVSDRLGFPIGLFGELFGPKIMKGVDYGPPKRLLYFGVIMDGTLEPFATLEYLVGADLIVPIVATCTGLDAALAIPVEAPSKLSPGGDTREGLVIQPYDDVLYGDYGLPFLLKVKSKKFVERAHTPKEPTVSIADPEVAALNAQFRGYITLGRLQSVFSKYGVIEEPAQIGQYIRWVLEDAKEDFLADADVSNIDLKQLRQVFNVGSDIARLLKDSL